MTDCVQVTVTIGNRDDAAALCRQVVDARLAACVQLAGPITSTYRWQGAVKSAEEWLLVCKTTTRAYPRLEAFLRNRHPYDVPEIVATPIVAGNPDYLAWVRDSTGAPARR